MGPVNSYTEWGTLQEVIIGSHYNTRIGVPDISMQLLYHDNLARARRLDPSRSYGINQKYIEEREEDIANLAAVLEAHGVKVRRPLVLDTVREFETPYWKALTKACDNPRDQVMVVGDMLIETACCVRNRYYENDLLKPLFYEYFAAGAQWLCAPRPRLTEESLDRSYVESRVPEADERYEIIFDAAQCLRFGRDILFNVTTWNHELGLRWLRRVLGDRHRVHKVRIVDNHLDGGILPLRPGKLLVNPRVMRNLDTLPAPLLAWDRIIMEDIDPSAYSAEDLLLASKLIDVNVLSINDEHVIVNEHATTTLRALERNGFVPIPIRFRHSRVFGGGLHCVSLDIRRDEGLEDYFS